VGLGQKSLYSRDLAQSATVAGIRSELWPLYTFLTYIPAPSIQYALKVFDRLDSYARMSIERSIKLGENNHTIFGKVLRDKAATEKGLTELEMRQEAKSFIIAGTDTTAVTMTYLVWVVLKYPAVRQRLQEEVETLQPDFTNADAQNLKFFNLVLLESMRLYGAVPGGLPRVVPKGGRELGGYFLPEYTEISTQAYTLHRNADIFPKPYEYVPRLNLGIDIARLTVG